MSSNVADEILDVSANVTSDDSITKIAWHTHQPYITTTFLNNDEIRIPVQQQDIYTLPSASFVYIEGKIEGGGGGGGGVDEDVKLTNNGIAYLFDEIRYELNGIEVDRTKSLGITTTVKGYVSFAPNEVTALENAGWTQRTAPIGVNVPFSVCLPLKILLGFAEDFNKIVINARQELILIRAKNDDNSLVGGDGTAVVKLNKVQWKMPYIYVANPERIALLKLVERNRPLYMNFRSWSTYEFPMLPETTKHTWAIKTSSQLEKPRYVLLVFQTDRKNKRSKDASVFDHCDLTDVKLYLNSESYPYSDLNLDFDAGKYALSYDMYTRFQSSYYNRTGGHCEPLFGLTDFKNIAPIFVIDCARQNESIKSATVDIRLEFESKTQFPPNTSATCVIIHDRVISYNPFTNVVHKVM